MYFDLISIKYKKRRSNPKQAPNECDITNRKTKKNFVGAAAVRDFHQAVKPRRSPGNAALCAFTLMALAAARSLPEMQTRKKQKRRRRRPQQMLNKHCRKFTDSAI